MRLYVRISAAEKLLGALDCKRLHNIDHLAAAVIALAGITFRILVCERTSHGSHDRFADPVLRCDQFDMIILTLNFLLNRGGDFRIDFSYFFNRIHLLPPDTHLDIELIDLELMNIDI